MPSCVLLRGPGRIGDDYLQWYRNRVQGRPAEYGVAGPDGPPVVFLHGYAMGSHAYKRPLRRLARRGCRVWAPALPSFGASAGLPDTDADLGGYATWVADFMAEVGIAEPVILIGHSFGGGVATKLAHSRPDLVSHVVLLNAVGGVSPRPLRDWTAGFVREFSSLRDTVELAVAARDDILTNLVRNPLGLLRAGRTASQADLRDELAELAGLGVPALVLTSEGDSVIPLHCFEAVCEFLGTPGQVVSGNHSWLLTDPESFTEVMGSIVDVEVASHLRRRAMTRAAEVTSVLSSTRIPDDTIEWLVSQASALWLTSDSPGVLAGDLALCHPALKPGEVRAAVAEGDGSCETRITVAAGDRTGLLADSAGVLAANGLSVTSATATTWHGQGLALHAFCVRGPRPLDEGSWQKLAHDLRHLADGSRRPSRWIPLRPVSVDTYVVGDGLLLIRLSAPDRVGVLAAACRWFADRGLSIEAVHARTVGRRVEDTFIVAPQLPVVPADVKLELKRHLEGR